MTELEIIQRIQDEEGKAYGLNDSQLSKERSEALDYYLGEKFGNEVEGRSQVVSYDVQDTIESALPQLLKIFVSGDQVVKFDAKGPEDQEAADQETDYVNHVVMETNPGYRIFYEWFKDALMQKNGYVKVWYEETEKEETELYKGLSDVALVMLLQDESIEVLEHTAYPSVQGEYAMAQPEQLHDVKIQKKYTKGCIKVDTVAPESIMVSIDTRGLSLQESRFVQHREEMSKADIEANGWKVPTGAPTETDKFDQEANSRDLYGEDSDTEVDNYLVKDTYFVVDGKRKRYVVIAESIVFEDDAEIVPFAAITPMIMPHRHIGRSYADLTKDIQLIKSAMIRGQLDNMYLSNNGRYAVSDRVNLDDMLTSRPGGVVRISGQDIGQALTPLSHTPFPPSSFTMVEYLDSMKEKRTGVTAYNQGLDSNSLNKTATGVQQIMNAAAQRLELVARTFAETGVKELFILVHRLVRKHYVKPDVVKLRNKWVEIDPREWKDRDDLTVSVGLGTGNKDQQLAHLTQIIQLQTMGLQLGISTPKNVYNAAAKMTQNAGFRNPEEFWSDPESQEAQQRQAQQSQQPNPEMVKVQSQMQIEQMKLQAKEKEIQMSAMADHQKAQMQLEHEQVRSQNDVAIEQARVQAEMELERWKAELEAQTELQKTQMKLQADKEIELMKAQSDVAVQMAQHKQELGGLVDKAKTSQGSDQTNAIIQGLQAAIESLNKPKQIVRDQQGRAVGVTTVQ